MPFSYFSLQHPSLKELEHRPWEMPKNPWIWRQSWKELSFLHFPVAVEELKKRVPQALEIDSFEGTAWVSLVPFFMEDVMMRNLPSIYPFKKFPELNARTYVKYGGKTGVYFFSLDASSLNFVLGGRIAFNLPYYLAKMKIEKKKQGHYHYQSQRRFANKQQFDVEIQYDDASFSAEKGSFEHWVAERYCLFTANQKKVSCVEVHHAPWQLHHASCKIHANDLLKTLGIQPLQQEPICHFSPGVDVIAWHPEKLSCCPS